MTLFWRAQFNRGLSRFLPFLLMMTVLWGAKVAQAAVAFATAGPVDFGTTALSVPHPAGIVAGDLLVLVVGNKYPTNGPSTPAGWTLVANGQQSGGLGTAALDSGQVYSTVFVKQAVGGESGALTVTITLANTSMGRMFRYSKAAGTSWDYAATNGSDNTAGTAWSVTGAANPGITSGDMVLVVSAINGNKVKRWDTQSVSATGAIFTTHTERQDSQSGTGDDMMLVVSDHTVTAGTASAAPVFTMTGDTAGGSPSENSPTGASILLRIREATTTTLATGSDPASATVAPGTAATDINFFTLQTNSGTETISSVTVNLSTLNGVGLLAITNSANTVLGSTTSPVTGANTISVTGMSATTTLTTFKVRVTPLSHALMPAVPGANYAITAPVTAWVGGGTHAHTGTDTNPNALTIDNLSPAGTTAVSGSAGNAQVTLNWTTSASADFSRSVMLRWTGSSAGAQVPAEGTDYAVGNTIGTATVVCVRTADAASTAVSGVDGAGTGGCSATALVNGQAYSYRIFQKDLNGNYDTGVTVGTFTPALAVGGFNAYETGTTPATAISGVIQTKVAGTSFTLDLVALNSAKTAIQTSFTGIVKVELLNSSDNSGALDANACRSSWTVLQTLANQTFAAGDAAITGTTGRHRITPSITENNAWRDVRVRVTYPATGAATAIGCSIDNFAIRPNTFANFRVSDNGTWDTAGTSRTLDDVTFGSVMHKAGRPISVRAYAVNAAGPPAVTSNYVGAPTATITACTGAACTATFGALTLDTTFAAGELKPDVATYDNVGAFELELVDSTFSAVDGGDGSTVAEREIRSGRINVGRFVPDHFVVTYNTPQFAAACGASTYIGQPFTYTTTPLPLPPVITVTAQNYHATTPAPTTLYAGNWWRITNTSLTGKSYTAASGTLDSSGIPGSDPTISSTGAGAGTLTFTAGSGLLFTRSVTTPVAPFDADIRLAINVIDADGVALASNPASFSAATAGNGIAFSGGKQMRFGRLRLLNAYGSELLDLPIPVQTQFWSGSAFVTNTDDNCTTLASSSIALSNYQKSLNSGETGVSPATVNFVAGIGSMKLTRPGAGNSGSADLCVDLGPDPAGGTVCSATSANLPFLQGKWPPGTNWNNDPDARATFGIYKSPLIYRRENY